MSMATAIPKTEGGARPFSSSTVPSKSKKDSVDSSNGSWKHQEAMADKLSNNSEDSGIVDWNDPKSIKERNRQILEGQMSCDVMFYVGEKKEKLGAHKYILTSRSDVFRHMFNGPDGLKSEFNIPDICADCFWEVLRHMYCDDQKLQVLNVVGVLCAADRYDLLSLRNSCLDFLNVCLEVNNVCFLMTEVHKYGYYKEERELLNFTYEHAESVLQTPGVTLLSRDMLNQIITYPGIQLSPGVKNQALDKWAKHHCQKNSQDPNMENLMDSLQDCLYVSRESSSHRYVMDSVTTSNLKAKLEEPIQPSAIDDAYAAKENTAPDNASIVTASTRHSSVHTNSLLPSYNMWADLDQVTRLQEVCGSDNNDAKRADAISFTTDHSIYLYGFSIYGPKKDGEGKYKVDTVLTRKKKDIIMESIQIKGAGVILPVMFERPVKVDRKTLYTLEIYVTGPVSHMGSSGQTKLSYRDVTFTFSNASKIKKNRSNISEGQIPRLYFLPRNKK